MTEFFTINGRTYAYTVQGEGTPLVLLHGFTGRKETWDPFFAKFAKGYQVIAIDLPGHGESFSQGVVTMMDFVEDFHLFMKNLVNEPFHLLGYSFGGRSALSYAMQYPERIRTLILESASPGLRTKEERLERQESDRQLAEKIEREGVASFVDYWEAIPLFSSQKRLTEKAWRQQRKERLSQSASGLAMSLLGMGTGFQPSWWEDLDQINFPVLLIVGEEDGKFVRINKEMERQIPTAELQKIKEAGHATHLEQPAIFLEYVKAFVDKN